MLKKAGYYIFILVTVILFTTPIVTYWRQKPTLAVTIRSWSMYPLITRGDMVFVLPTGAGTRFTEGQIVVFRSAEHGIRDWTMHRIVGGDSESGFITKGDNNDQTDQEGGHYPPIRREWIAGIVPTIGSLPLKIPLLGYIPLLIEENMKNPRLLLLLLGILASALLLDEVFKTKRRQRKDILQKGQVYLLGGVAFAIMLGALMLMRSVFISLPYGVERTAGALLGSEVGILEIGDSRELTLVELENKGTIPSYYCVISRDPQITVHQDRFLMRGGDTAQVVVTVNAREEGIFNASIIVGMFMPFLPPPVIGFLAGISFWLAIVVVSSVPALPLIILPYLEPRYRRRFVREIRRRWARTLGGLHL
jgi:signal peptidase